MSRHTFSAHLTTLCTSEASPHSFDFKRSLIAGFRDTGIFPFQPDLIRNTVDMNLINHDSAAPTALSKDSPTLQTVADLLRTNEKFTDTQVEASLNSLVGISAGHRSAVVTYTAAAGKVFAMLKVRKQRRVKDSRLEIEKGRNMLEPEYMAALVERDKKKENAAAIKKARKLSSNVSKKDLTVPSKAKPRKKTVPAIKKPRKAVKNSKKQS